MQYKDPCLRASQRRCAAGGQNHMQGGTHHHCDRSLSAGSGDESRHAMLQCRSSWPNTLLREINRCAAQAATGHTNNISTETSSTDQYSVRRTAASGDSSFPLALDRLLDLGLRACSFPSRSGGAAESGRRSSEMEIGVRSGDWLRAGSHARTGSLAPTNWSSISCRAADASLPVSHESLLGHFRSPERPCVGVCPIDWR